MQLSWICYHKNLHFNKCGYEHWTTVGGYYIAHFAEKYCSEVSKFLWTQMSQKVAVAFIFVVFVFARHESSNQTYMVCTYVHTYVHMYIHFKIRFSIGETAINRRRCQLKGCFLENKLSLTIGESLEWSKSKFNLICSF